ncbi:MAG: hypothetical protein IBX40_13110 [Methanosarcinales archaeon]|nr:hypothetical protein [Methanosarcinales archaeon]
MLILLDKFLLGFRCCFSRNAAFCWFVIIIMGFIVRFDHQGVTSFIRWLFLEPQYYDLLLRFFRANSWTLDCLLSHWAMMVLNLYPIIKFNGRPLLIGDGIKVCKEAKKMPGVKYLHQDSDNSGKGEYIYGHHIGFVGLLVGYFSKAFCLPMHGQLHEGVDAVRPGEGINGKPATIVTRMAHLVVQKALNMGCLCYVALDAYFSTGPAFLIFKAAVNDMGEQLVHIVTRAKDNYVGYLDREFSDRKFHEDDKIKLMEYFEFPEFFKKAELTIYGQVKTIEYCCLDLLWKPINGWVRFVCVRDGHSCYILMSSDLQLPATEIITIYSYRSKIEVMFLFLKHLIGGFCYHFWTKAFPELKRGKKPDLSILSKPDLEKVERTVKAIEGFINLAGIAMGLLQYLALTQPRAIWNSYQGWLRTRSSDIPSEGIVQSVLQAEFFSTAWKVPVCLTLRIIRKKFRKGLLDTVP